MFILHLLLFSYGLIMCLMGYKIFRLQLVITGAIVGGGLGYLIGLISGDESALVILVAALLFGFLSYSFYLVSIFANAFFITTGIFFLLTVDLLGESGATAFAFIVGLICAIIAIKFTKYVLVIQTAMTGASVIGLQFNILSDDILNSGRFFITFAIFLALGLYMQFKFMKQSLFNPEGGAVHNEKINFNEMGQQIGDMFGQAKDSVDNFSRSEAGVKLNNSVNNARNKLAEKLNTGKTNYQNPQNPQNFQNTEFVELVTCSNCGVTKEVTGGKGFCSSCGNKL